MTIVSFNLNARQGYGKNTVSLFACGRLNIAVPVLA